MKTDVYAVFEVTPDGTRLVGVFPGTDAGCEAAIEWGKDEYRDFHAAKPNDAITGTAYMTKSHGVHVFDDESGSEE